MCSDVFCKFFNFPILFRTCRREFFQYRGRDYATSGDGLNEHSERIRVILGPDLLLLAHRN